MTSQMSYGVFGAGTPRAGRRPFLSALDQEIHGI